ncbi:MAG: glucan biosynthesis protein [Pseudomonadota bacterium]
MIDRRAVLGGALVLATPRVGWAQSEPETLEALAEGLSRQPHRNPAMELAPPFDDLTYNSFRAIRPAEGGAAGIPLGDGFSADLLPPGFYFQDRVAVEIERSGELESVEFDPSLFSYGERYFDTPPQMSASDRANMGFSGARLRTAYREADVTDEFFVTQGASYFRAVSRETLYGLSSRALAIGTGGAAPEEFPVFTRLRLHEAQGGRARLDALIESPSLTGAARLVIMPGEPTNIDVDLVLFPRVTLDTVGISPLTSMYFKGPLRDVVADDFRPRVHDSDALHIENGAGEMLWRPLSNPAALQTSAFADRSPRGFGLIQSARRFADFEDPEAAYHRRPSAWIEPQGDWGAGSVMLVEIPTDDEFFDNIVAFWRPAEPLVGGKKYRFGYRISLGSDPLADRASRIEVVQSRSGLVHDRPGFLQYIVDFKGTDLQALSPMVEATEGVVEGVSAYPIVERGHLRVGFQFKPADAAASELRLVLRSDDASRWSDVWLHRWTPSREGGP